ncbi:hypothetical protein [Sphingomonas sanxanigenens]|nr:hypothetical protein [Sphingomonas sanxanigenens]
MMKGRRSANERLYEIAGWIVWHAGLLTGIGTNAPNKYPKLERLMGLKPKPVAKPQSEVELNANLRAWGALLKRAAKTSS